MRVRISSSFHLTRGKFIYTMKQWRRGSIGWIYVMCHCLCYHLLSVKKEGDTSADKLCSFLQHNPATHCTYDWQRQDQVWINRSEMQSWLPSLKVADLQTVSFIITSCYEQSHSVTFLNGWLVEKMTPNYNYKQHFCSHVHANRTHVIFFVCTVILKILVYQIVE